MSEKMTGYPSIDKPWSDKYVDKTLVRDISSYDNIYDLIFCNRKDMERIVISYISGGCQWSLQKLKNKTDNFIRAFLKEGIKEGDVILCGVLTTPEFVAAFIALVSIGAVVKFFDIRASEQNIISYAQKSKCKYAIGFEQIVVPKYVNIIDSTEIKRVYIVSPANSFSSKEKINYILKRNGKKGQEKIICPDDKRFVNLTKICKMGNKGELMRVKSDFERPAVMVQSSGTTGAAKTIVHSERGMIGFANSTLHMDVPIGEKDGLRIFVALPPWIAYGIGNAIINPIIFDSTIELSTDFEPDAVYRNIGRFDMVYAAPFHYRYIRDHYKELDKQKKLELAKVDSFVAGGDKYSAEENKSDEELFGVTIVNGYGNNECWGCITVNPNYKNKHGSVGIPIYGYVVIIYDSVHENELPYDTVGEVCVLSDTKFLGYENDKLATEKVLKMHGDGKTYLHTGDYGYIDSEGYLFIVGREQRVITRLGFKLSAYTIEDAICSFEYIKECIVVEVPDEVEEHVPMAFVVLQNECHIPEHELIELLKEDCNKVLKYNEVPKHFMVVNSLLYTNNNKYDFRVYENMGKDYVTKLSI